MRTILLNYYVRGNTRQPAYYYDFLVMGEGAKVGRKEEGTTWSTKEAKKD